MKHAIRPGEGVTLLRLTEVIARVRLGRSAIYERIKQGSFPAPVKVGGRAVAWNSSEISAWIGERIANRRLNGGAKE